MKMTSNTRNTETSSAVMLIVSAIVTIACLGAVTLATGGRQFSHSAYSYPIAGFLGGLIALYLFMDDCWRSLFAEFWAHEPIVDSLRDDQLDHHIKLSKLPRFDNGLTRRGEWRLRYDLQPAAPALEQ
jgi:hypothetical protein